LEIDNDDTGDDKQDKSKLSADNIEIDLIQKDNLEFQKNLNLLKNRKKNIHLVCDQVNNWSNKVQNKLNDQCQNQDI